MEKSVSHARIFIGIFLISTSVLMLELSLTRLFSATMYYHFAFMSIALALFGSGASGVFIYITQGRLNSSDKWLSTFSSLFAISVVLALVIILYSPLALGAATENYPRLIRIFIATAVPFFLAGCTISLAVSRYARDINRLYLFDLAGAALGCLLLIPLMNAIGAVNLIIIVGATAAAAAVFFSLRSGRTITLVLPICLFAAITLFGIYNAYAGLLDIRSSKGYEELNLLFTKWNSFSRITVQEEDNKLEIKIDADAATVVVPDGRNIALHADRQNDVSALAYHIKNRPSTLIIGPGGGFDVATALVFDASKIAAVEINPIIARDIMQTEPFRSYNGGIYSDPRVELHVDEGRSFIRRSGERYDLIQATMVDTWAATGAGAFALSENNLYTVEAFSDYARHLSDDGVLTMTRWYFDPPDQLLRLVSISRAMMDDLGIGNPERHFVIIRGTGDVTYRSPASFIFKKSEFSDDEIRSLESVAAANNFEVLYSPLTQPDNAFSRLIKAKDMGPVLDAFPTNISPTYDNDPFFFNSIRLRDLATVFEKSGEWKKTNLGSLILFILLIFTTIIVALFILLPLFIFRKRDVASGSGGTLSYLFYFGCLGAGFIIVEIAMIQKFILFLGHPVYSLSVVLFSLLTFCALGSYISRKFLEATLPQTLIKLVILIAAVTVGYILLLPPIFYGLVWLPLEARIAIAVALIAPLAIIMGMPMPVGIRILSERKPNIIPWGWGVNGATSVMGSVATLVIAIFAGFNQALLLGALIYLLAPLFMNRALSSSYAGKV